MFFVYIIKSGQKDWYYVGSTNNLERRLKEHNSKKVSSTKSLIPFTIVYTRGFENEIEARSYEQKLKKVRREKESIIRSLS